MREAITEAILTVLGEAEVIAILGHGSSLKHWDSPIDYVPEISDVDVQVVLRDPGLLDDHLENALAIQRQYERRYAQRKPTSRHFPRPQIMVINRLLTSPEFLSGPPGTGATLYGKPFEELRPQPDPRFVTEVDRKTLLGDANRPWLENLPSHIIDRPGKFLFQPLRDLSWRVAPLAPRVLSVLGARFEEAWGQNRTGLVQSLNAHGQPEFADAYAGFYLEGWNFFLSGYSDADAARRALLAGRDVLERAVEVARSN